MPIYSHDVPDQPSGHALPIRRTPSYGALTAIVTTPDILGCYTHYWHGRTIPCEKPDCEPCNDGSPFRWHSYLAAWETKTALHFIFEMTAAAVEPLISYRDAHGTIRGCLFQAKRWKERPNGRILIQTKPADLTEINLPNPPDMEKCLATLWNLNLPQPEFRTRSQEKRSAIVPLGKNAAKFPRDENGNPMQTPPQTNPEKPGAVSLIGLTTAKFTGGQAPPP